MGCDLGWHLEKPGYQVSTLCVLLSMCAVSDRLLCSHLSPFIFTNTLLPLMAATAKLPDSDVRIVNVRSFSHLKASSS